ncbi:MAG: hypothetical protein ORN53_07855, partial [Crocinitomicaceae bacterium]|nr:hypothetical protein [Crocinitomicaceae bacterium]
MKDGLENSFKEALNQFELPYDAQAWESLNKKLSAKKWYQATQIKWSAALVIAIGIAAYFVLPTSAERSIKETHNKTTKKETNSPSTVAPDQREARPATTQSVVDNATNPKEIEPLMSPGFTPPIVVTELIPHSIPLILDQLDVLGITDQAIDNQESTPSYNGGVAIIDFKNRCQGETLQLEADKHHERLINYAGKEVYVRNNEPVSLKLTEPGKVILTANSGPYGQFEEFGSFNVSATPTLNILSDR